MRVGGHEIVGNRHAFDDFDALAGQRIVLHVAHGDEAVDSLQAEPVHHIRHQLLEPGVLHACDAFGALEILGRSIAAFLALACVVDQKLRDLAERAAFLAIVNDDAESAGLSGACAFLDAVDQIGTAGADVRAEHIRAIALVMHAAGYLGGVVRQFADVAEQIGRRAADRREKNLQIRPRHQFRKHARGLFEQLPAQIVFGGRKALGQARQIPYRVDRDFDHRDASVLVYELAVMLEPAGFDCRLQFGQIETGAGNGNARTDVDAFGDFLGEVFSGEMSPRIERDDLLRVGPLRKRPDRFGGMGIGEIRTPDRIERAG